MLSPSIWLIVVVATLKVSQVASACTRDITLHIFVEHYQNSYTSAYRYEKNVQSSSGFKSAYNSFSTSASASASESASGLFFSGGFSASASFALAKVGSEITSMSDFSESIKEQKTTYNPRFLQISRKVTTTVSIDGLTSKHVVTEIVDSVPTSSPLTAKQLRERSNLYLTSHFYDDTQNVHGQTYSKTCRRPPPPGKAQEFHGELLVIRDVQNAARYIEEGRGVISRIYPRKDLKILVAVDGIKIIDKYGNILYQHGVDEFTHILQGSTKGFAYILHKGNKKYQFFNFAMKNEPAGVVNAIKHAFDRNFVEVPFWNSPGFVAFKLEK